MSQTYYTSLSGMVAASFGLQNTSNNVANMQTPGYKRNDVFYAALGGQNRSALGYGVEITGQRTNFNAGKYNQTNSPTDLAVVGDGFFIVREKNGQLLYTRNGEFAFNDEHFLADKNSGSLVMGYDEAGQLAAIKQLGPETADGKMTTNVHINGVLHIKKIDKKDNPVPVPIPDMNPQEYEPITFTLDNIFDKNGVAHSVQVKCISKKPDISISNDTHWVIESIYCKDAHIEMSALGQEIIFDNSYKCAKEGNNSFNFTMNGVKVQCGLGNYTAGADKSLMVYDSSDVTSPNIKPVTIFKQDGYAFGKQTSFSFDEEGLIHYHYDNGQSKTGNHVVLARFDEMEHTLQSVNNNLFSAKSNRGRHIGIPNKHGFGTIKAQQIEGSNVDSTMEFANIVVLQRMFQACSQIMDIDKQLLEELNKK